MNRIVAVLTRELRTFLVSPMGWGIIIAFLLYTGFAFMLIISVLIDPRAPFINPFRFYSESFFFWMFLLFATPVLTMRLFSEERKTGSIEMLLTTPISEGEAVIGKFLGVLLFYIVLWLPTLVYIFLLKDKIDFDWGNIASWYLGIILIGAFYLSVGTFASTLTRNQVIAAMYAFIMSFLLLLPSFLTFIVTGEPLKTVISYLDVLSHLQEFSAGVVDSRRLVYYLSGIAFFLFTAARSLEMVKWR